MGKDFEKSLGDQATFGGKDRRASEKDTAQSLGDQITVGGGDVIEGGDLGDGMEVVDLSARYRVERTLGKGGMGEVVLATDTRLGRKVAIKRILGEAVRSRAAVNRFLTEAKSIAALNHLNIVQIYDYGRSIDGPFLIMEYVDGSSLLDRCRAGALPLEEAVELTCQLCDGLAKAHDAGIVHRDIKPANVLMTGDGIPKLTDFGLAKVESADTGMTMAGAVLGTLDFMSPEQRRDAALTDARSDLWSLAATLYQMVTGRSPKIIKFNDVPLALQQVLGKALEDAKEDRYQTAREFKEALKNSLTANTASAASRPADLGAGECPACHLNNESHRKFCRECGDSLRCACLKCQTEIPVWEKVCPECGGKQAVLIKAKLEELAGQKASAESFVAKSRFPEAIELAQRIAEIQDRRISRFGGWATKFIADANTDWEQAKLHAESQLQEARVHCSVFDYESAIHALESIPHPLRTEETSQYLVQLQSDREEAARLLETIGERLKTRNLTGLLAIVERAIKLRGNRQDLTKLQTKLRDREEKVRELREKRDGTYTEAAELLERGEAQAALERINSLESVTLRPEHELIKQRATTIVNREQDLMKLIAECKADGVITDEEKSRMVGVMGVYLQLNPRSKRISALYNQAVNSALQKASALGKQCRFEEAIATMLKFHRSFLPTEARDLLSRYSVLSQKRRTALNVLAAVESGGCFNYVAAANGNLVTYWDNKIPAVDDYRESLKSSQLHDAEFEQIVKNHLQKKKSQK